MNKIFTAKQFQVENCSSCKIIQFYRIRYKVIPNSVKDLKKRDKNIKKQFTIIPTY